MFPPGSGDKVGEQQGKQQHEFMFRTTPFVGTMPWSPRWMPSLWLHVWLRTHGCLSEARTFSQWGRTHICENSNSAYLSLVSVTWWTDQASPMALEGKSYLNPFGGSYHKLSSSIKGYPQECHLETRQWTQLSLEPRDISSSEFRVGTHSNTGKCSKQLFQPQPKCVPGSSGDFKVTADVWWNQ